MPGTCSTRGAWPLAQLPDPLAPIIGTKYWEHQMYHCSDAPMHQCTDALGISGQVEWEINLDQTDPEEKRSMERE